MDSSKLRAVRNVAIRCANNPRARAITDAEALQLCIDIVRNQVDATTSVAPLDGVGANSSVPCELEVRHVWSGNGSHELEPMQIVTEAIEQPLAGAE